MGILFKVLTKVDGRRVIILVLVAAAAALAAYVRLQQIELNKAELVYQHPDRRTARHIERRQGPVRIVTRVIERTTGERETLTDEYRGPVEDIETLESEIKAVPLATALAPPAPTTRLLAGISLRDWAPNEWQSYGVWAGVGLFEHADILVGLERRDRIEQRLLLVWRF